MKLTSLTPILNVSDVVASLEWFEALGWERGFAWDHEGGMRSTEPTFASIQSGAAEIFVCLDAQGARGAWLSWFLPGHAELEAAYARARELVPATRSRRSPSTSRGGSASFTSAIPMDTSFESAARSASGLYGRPLRPPR